jgi:hypothetical protein
VNQEKGAVINGQLPFSVSAIRVKSQEVCFPAYGTHFLRVTPFYLFSKIIRISSHDDQ